MRSTKTGKTVSRSSLSGGQAAFFYLELFGEEQGAGGRAEAELDFVGLRGREPRAAYDADIALLEFQLGDVLGETNEIVDDGLTHEFLHGWCRSASDLIH